jgi:DNA-directed RNA polymerase subunit omega
MTSEHDTMMTPRIEGLLDRAGSKFTLVTLGATRARQINSYYNQLAEGIGTVVPPQVTSSARKSLSIAFEEIAADKIVGVRRDPEAEAAEGEADGEADSPVLAPVE